MIVIEDNRLEFSLPEVHRAARCRIEFQRTLRIPDDGRDYPLPPGLGRFPLRHLDDYAERLPESWRERGGVIAPIHQSEALWINFDSGYPFAVKVATGKICAITGDPWVDRLNRDPQDYAVLPEQPWLDGYCVNQGVIRQFVAMPLGEGYTVEEQLTGAAVHGGLQLVAYPMKAARYEALRPEPGGVGEVLFCMETGAPPTASMGLAPGGRMKQEIYDDPYGLDAWDLRHGSRCFRLLVELVPVDDGHGHEAAERAARGAGLHRPRSALVRLLRRGSASGGRQRPAAGAQERRRARQDDRAGAAAGQRDDCGAARDRGGEAAVGA